MYGYQFIDGLIRDTLQFATERTKQQKQKIKTNEKKEKRKKIAEERWQNEEPNICAGERIKGCQGQPNELPFTPACHQSA